MNRLTLLASLAVPLALACAPAHIDAYQPKRRQYVQEGGAASEAAPLSAGSLYRGDVSPYADTRAMRMNDLVTVRVEELADARRTSDLGISREGETRAAISTLLSVAGQPVTPEVEGSLTAGSGSRFDASGSTARTERLVATVPAVVRQVLPNGNLFIEGHRVVLVNAEEQHFYISGVVRPLDIAKDNSIKSSLIADAEVEFTGRGALTEPQQRGVLARFFGWIWPF